MTCPMQKGNMKITYCISAFLASLVAFTAQALPGPTSATFDKGALFTVAGYTGASTLSGFPVLVRIAGSAMYLYYSAAKQRALRVFVR